MLGSFLLFGAAALAAPAAAQAHASTAQSGTSSTHATSSYPRTVSIPISFEVQNVNRTSIQCQSDGKTYTVRGHLWAPAEALTNHQQFDTATLYLHGLGLGEFFWVNQEVTGYNFAAQQARQGHVSVTVDRLGYDSSDHPNGADICFGSRADIAHQMVQDLRSGKYSLDGATSRSFGKIVIAGHSVGSLIAETEAENFGDVDGVIALSFSNTVTTQLLLQSAMEAVHDCQTGHTVTSGGAPNYVPFAETAQAFVNAFFYTPGADARVVAGTTALRNPDPCGDVESYMTATRSNVAHAAQVKVPMLFAGGLKDALYPQPAAVHAQARLFSNAPSEIALFPATGHAILQHYTHYQVEQRISTWLDQHGFGNTGKQSSGNQSTAYKNTGNQNAAYKNTGTRHPCHTSTASTSSS